MTDSDPSSENEFGWRGWVLVIAVVIAFLVVPVIILLIPPGIAGYTVALVVLPLLPAVALATIAVWAALRG